MAFIHKICITRQIFNTASLLNANQFILPKIVSIIFPSYNIFVQYVILSQYHKKNGVRFFQALKRFCENFSYFFLVLLIFNE